MGALLTCTVPDGTGEPGRLRGRFSKGLGGEAPSRGRAVTGRLPADRCHRARMQLTVIAAAGPGSGFRLGEYVFPPSPR
ncbi:hypothetical protein SCA03_24160 [Streptomyces cacaoi]|uniref:Uncharacterized protein n=1 Tax=Streptomyces cacaoi TaxID=1898 RepID=A0A4Y3QWW4_STRCI|nr:hypothetical protein SCA03_24160 [Streptomyces cacaoi]